MRRFGGVCCLVAFAAAAVQAAGIEWTWTDGRELPIEGDAFCADRNYTVEGVHLNDWGAWNVGRAFAEAVRAALGLRPAAQ